LYFTATNQSAHFEHLGWFCAKQHFLWSFELKTRQGWRRTQKRAAETRHPKRSERGCNCSLSRQRMKKVVTLDRLEKLDQKKGKALQKKKCTELIFALVTYFHHQNRILCFTLKSCIIQHIEHCFDLTQNDWTYLLHIFREWKVESSVWSLEAKSPVE